LPGAKRRRFSFTSNSTFFRADSKSLNQIRRQSALAPMLASNQVVVVRKPGRNLHLGQDALHYVGIELPEP
jgi:hypothetical protein